MEAENLPELKLSGEPAVLCTGEYTKRKELLSRMLGVSFIDADRILQENGIDRLVGISRFMDGFNEKAT